MPVVFISGSRVIPFIPEEALSRVDHMISGCMDIVVGDSEKGVDARIAAYLFERQYDCVSVYTTRNEPRIRNLLPTWSTVSVSSHVPPKRNAQGEISNRRSIETEKDRAMADAAEFGLVVWQSEYKNRFGKVSVSKGSLRNMHQLLSAGKPVVLYRYHENDNLFEQLELRSLGDLQSVVDGSSGLIQRAYAAICKSEAAEMRERQQQLF